MTDQVNEAVTNLYHAVNAMLLVVGRDGEIDSRHESTAAVMQALRAIDGGQYTPELQIQAHPSRGVVDEVAERRALNKALDALDALSERWASEIGLDAMCANLAKAEDVPAAIRAMAVQAWVEGAYAGRTSHQAAQPAVPSVPVSLRDALEEALRWSPKSFAGSDAIRRFQALAGDYVQRLIEEAAALQAAQPAVPSVPDVFILDRGFKYENGEHTPTVLVGFAPGDFDARDRFAASLAATPKDQPAQGVEP